jgi:hypothetical protein
MWDYTVELLDGGRTQRYRLRRAGGGPVSFGEVLRFWQDDEGFRSSFLAVLAGAPYGAYRWETPPVTAATAGREFEFVLLHASGLDGPSDDQTFAEKFAAADGAPVTVFPNLGNDAVLVVPLPGGPPSAYRHLAAFVRGGHDPQKHALWEAVGAAMRARLGANPVWLSTAGMGVAWLHVRLDSVPKYYGFEPYKDPA